LLLGFWIVNFFRSWIGLRWSRIPENIIKGILTLPIEKAMKGDQFSREQSCKDLKELSIGLGTTLLRRIRWKADYKYLRPNTMSTEKVHELSTNVHGSELGGDYNGKTITATISFFNAENSPMEIERSVINTWGDAEWKDIRNGRPIKLLGGKKVNTVNYDQNTKWGLYQK
jgi:hypothetical protein